MTKEEAIEYLTNVIEHWDSFCEGHHKFAEAIKVLIKGEKQNEEDCL